VLTSYSRTNDSHWKTEIHGAAPTAHIAERRSERPWQPPATKAHLRPAILIFYTGSAMFQQTASHATISQNLPNGLGLLLAAMFFPGMHPSSASEAPYYF